MTEIRALTVADLWLELARLPAWAPVYIGDEKQDGPACGIETHGPEGGVIIFGEITSYEIEKADPVPTLQRVLDRIAQYRTTNATSDAYNPIGVEALLKEIESLCDDDIPF